MSFGQCYSGMVSMACPESYLLMFPLSLQGICVIHEKCENGMMLSFM